MTCQSKEDAMDIDVSKATNGHCSVIKKNGLLLYPVAPQVGGEGLPYAPINWPDPGDTWSWRVGRRTSVSGYHVDRYLYPPSRLQKSRKGKESFKSKLSVQEYIQALCPNVDVEAFFSSFSWKIPSKQAFLLREHHDATCMLSEERTEESLSDCQNGDPACKAGNRFCRGLTEEANIEPVNTMFCDICCIEANFCRDCSCILCCKTIDLALGGYSFIRCEAEVHDGLVCGHSAHLVCALRCYLAGTVGGTIGLDAEYYCRRCDSKTGLVEHVTKIFKTCESVESPGDVKKMLDLVVCLTRGSQKGDAKRLMNRAQRALQKFECGNVVGNILEAEEDISTVKTDNIFKFPAMKMSAKILAAAARRAARRAYQKNPPSDILARPSIAASKPAPGAGKAPSKRSQEDVGPELAKKRRFTKVGGIHINEPRPTVEGDRSGGLEDSSATESEDIPIAQRLQLRTVTSVSTHFEGGNTTQGATEMPEDAGSRGEGARGDVQGVHASTPEGATPTSEAAPRGGEQVEPKPVPAVQSSFRVGDLGVDVVQFGCSSSRPLPTNPLIQLLEGLVPQFNQAASAVRSINAAHEEQRKYMEVLEGKLEARTSALEMTQKRLEELEPQAAKVGELTTRADLLEQQLAERDTRIKELESHAADKDEESKRTKAELEGKLAALEAKLAEAEKHVQQALSDSTEATQL